MKGPTMHYDLIAIPGAEIPQTVGPMLQYVITTNASQANTLATATPICLLTAKSFGKIVTYSQAAKASDRPVRFPMRVPRLDRLRLDDGY
jgi:hypothetical protein